MAGQVQEAPQETKMGIKRVFSLRLVIGSLSAFFVLAVAAVALLVTASSSLKALNDNGEAHVAALGNAATFRVLTFFERPFQQVTALAALPETEDLCFPSTHISANLDEAARVSAGVRPGGLMLDRFAFATIQSMLDFSMTLFSTGYWLKDGTRMFVFALPQYKNALYLELWWRNNATGVLDQRETIMYDTVSRKRVLPSDARYQAFMPTRVNTTFIDSKNPLIWALIEQLVPTKRNVVTWLSPAIFHLSVPFRYITAISEAHNSSTQLGISASGVSMGSIGAQLDATKTSAKSMIILVMNYGFVLGASDSVETFNISDYNGQPAVPPPGCTTTDQSSHTITSDRRVMSCMHHLRDLPNAAARMIAAKFPYDGRVMPIQQFKMKTDGKTNFVRIHPIDINASVIVLIPEEEILGNVKSSIFTAGFITVGAVVLAAILCAGLLWWLLSPLHRIAERMDKAARLEEDPEPIVISPLVEIGDLQRAFLAMREKLNDIRSYVPHSLLHAADSDSTDSLDEYEHQATRPNDADPSITDTGTSISTAPHSSTSNTPHHRRISGPAQSGSGTMRRVSQGPGAGGSLATVSSEGGAAPMWMQRAGTAGRTRPELAVFPTSAGPANPLNPATQPVTLGVGVSNGNSSRTSSSIVSKNHGVKIVSGIRREHVSILSINVCGFHDGFGRKSAVNQQKIMSDLVDLVLTAVMHDKGVVDSFQGDRFLISFNAVKPAANHEIRAVTAAIHIAEAVAKLGFRSTAGVASGRAQIGNMGSKRMMRFTIVGPVVVQATALERLCKVYNTGAQQPLPEQRNSDLHALHSPTRKTSRRPLSHFASHASMSRPAPLDGGVMVQNIPAVTASPACSAHRHSAGDSLIDVIPEGERDRPASIARSQSGVMSQNTTVLSQLSSVTEIPSPTDIIIHSDDEGRDDAGGKNGTGSTKEPPVHCLVPQRMFLDLATAAVTRTLDLVHLPHVTAPSLVASVDHLIRPGADDEWMYQLEAQEVGDLSNPINAVNATWAACARREFAKAQELRHSLQARALRAPGDAELKRASECPRLRANCQGPAPRELGEFYNKSLRFPAE